MQTGTMIYSGSVIKLLFDLLHSSNSSPVNDFNESQTINSATAHHIYLPNWDVTNDVVMANPVMCRNFIDHHSCMVSELRLRYEHEISVKERFEKKFVKSAKTIQQRDAKIVGLKSRLEKAEVEAAEAGVLHRRVSELEAMATTRQKRLRALSECEDLHGMVAGEAKLKEEFTAIQDAEAVGIQEGLEVGVKHGKAGRELGALTAYDLRVKAKYEEVMEELENISFPFLDQLESYKDAYLDRIGCLRVPGMVYREILFDDALEASCARARRTPLNSIVVSDYLVSDVSLIKDAAVNGSFPLGTQHFAFFCIACFVAAIYEVSWLEDSSTNFRVVVSFHLYFVFGFADYEFFPPSSSMSRLSSKASSFCTWSTSVHLSEGIPISTGITASMP
ncbi:hypothetical protein Tco_1121250 [Tanacetum coccineum]|uniref:Uncharacterized protein n=1 Tax=Tanacetum coccineum TaxID=301880 RepID=A0ABQ5IYP4_9ASTR